MKPSTELEKSTDALMKEIGAEHTSEKIDLSTVNPEYELSQTAQRWLESEERTKARNELSRRGLRREAFTYNCQRCVPTWEATRRGYKVTALPYDAESSGADLSWGLHVTSMWKDEKKIQMEGKTLRSDIESQMARWGDGARCEVRVAWKGERGRGHVFVAEQIDGKTVFIDPQSGKSDYDPFDDVVKRGVYSHCHWILRMDTNEFTEVAKRCFKPIDKE